MNKVLLVLFSVVAFASAQLAANPPMTTYKFYCAQCHGMEGKGDGINITADFATTPRDLSNSLEMAKLSDADLMNIILDGGPATGKSALMPAWAKTLNNGEVEDLIQVMRGFCACQGPSQDVQSEGN